MILINPYSSFLKEAHRLFRHICYIYTGIPRGVGILAGYLQQRGKTAKILDEQIIPVSPGVLDSLVKGLDLPYLFGISCVTANIKRGYEIAKIIRARYPDAKIIFGGIHPTVFPEEVLVNGSADIVVRKEGEESLDLLYDCVKNNRDYSEIKGISFFRKGRCIHNACREPFDLNLLPPFPYYLFQKDASQYYFGQIVTSRGCQNDCIFCCQGVISNGLYRYLSSDKVVAEIDTLINTYKQTWVNFVDDNFLTDKERAIQICRLICEKKLQTKAKFSCQARCDDVDGEILGWLREANFRIINFGLETGSERLLGVINKNESLAKNEEAVRLTKKHGFSVSATFIMGLPTESDAERRQTFRFAKRLSLDYAKFANAVPYPGTKLHQMVLEEGRLNAGECWENLSLDSILLHLLFNKKHLPYVPSDIEEKNLRRDILKANLFFLMRPINFLRRLWNKSEPLGWWVMLPRTLYPNPFEWLRVFKFLLKSLLIFLKD